MPRVLLLTSTTGYQAAAFREAATRLAIPLVLGSDRCHQLEDPWRDGALAVRFEQPEESARIIADSAKRNPLDAIVALGDLPAVTAAHAAALLRLPFHSPQAATAARSKFLSREKYRVAGLRQPWFLRVPAALEPAEAMRLVLGKNARPFPCVLKPLVLSGSRGVISADDDTSFAAAFRRIQTLLQIPDIRKMRDPEAEHILVEQFIAGAEVAVEAIVTRGEPQVLAIFEKPDPLNGPYFEETIYVTPPRLSQSDQQSIANELRRAVAALGSMHGPVHAELRVTPAGPVVLEIAARPIGGLCARALRFVHGERVSSLEELILRHALGEDVSRIARETQAAGVMMIPIPGPGYFEGVDGVQAAAAVAGVESIEITAKLRQKLVPLPEGASYLGFIFARAASADAVERALRSAHDKLQFHISPELTVLRA
jgi:biotin carboxylase